MQEKQLLMIPGPTPVPAAVLRALSQPMINHRGPEYEKMQAEIQERIKKVFQTENDILIFPSSGTGGMEASIVNLLSPGDKVLCVSIGLFGDRFAEIAQAFGAEVLKLDFEWGKAADPQRILEALKGNSKVCALIVTHNETSTGVTNDLKAISEAIKDFEIPLVVDAISSLAAIDLQTDNWGIDLVVAASQKALMTPPGLSFLSLSRRAWERNAQAKMPRYYWDWQLMKKYMERNQIPYTPALPQLFGLREALNLIEAEGLQNSFARHGRLAKATRAGIKALGLSLFADESYASNTVTSINLPPGVDSSALRKLLSSKYGVIIAGGQGPIRDKIIRIGHLGFVDEQDIIKTLSSLELALWELGYKELELGASLKAAQEILAKISKN